MKKSFADLFVGKKVLFVTTKNIDYIRNSQEIRLIEENAKSVDKVYSNKLGYSGRIMEVWIKLWKYKIKEVDVIFVGFAPQLVLPFFYRKMKNKIIVIDFFISMYDTLIHDRKRFPDKGIISKICHYLDYKTLEKAEYAITDTKADAQYFIEEFACDANKFETLYLEADPSIYYPREQHKRLDLKGKFVVLYFGSVLPLQGVDVVLDAIRLLKEERDIYFQMIGPIPSKYKKPIQSNVEYIDWLSQEELAAYIANADLCLAGHFSGEINKAKRTIPGKAYIYDAMKKKIVFGENEANHEKYKNDQKIYYYVPQGRADVLRDRIKEIKKSAWNN